MDIEGHRGSNMIIGIIPPVTRTGEFKYCETLVRGLNERGLEVKVLNNQFLVHKSNLKIFLGSLLLKRIIKEEVEILHNTDNLGPFLFRNSDTKIKRISTVHDIAPVVLPDIHSNIMKFDFKIVLPRLIENSDLIITDSYSTKEDLEEYFQVNAAKIDVAHLGVDLSFFYPREHDDILMKKYGINNDYIFYLGNDNPRKNLKNLIIAYSKIYKDVEQDLVLVGPIDQKNLRTLTEKIDKGGDLSERIITPGYVDYEHLPLFYSQATSLIFTSLYEGFGFAPLEAMACGTPVIISNNSSISEVVGDSGLYINNPLNVEEISNKITELLNDEKLQNKLMKRGPKRAEMFTWDNTINKTIKAYEKVY